MSAERRGRGPVAAARRPTGSRRGGRSGEAVAWRRAIGRDRPRRPAGRLPPRVVGVGRLGLRPGPGAAVRARRPRPIGSAAASSPGRCRARRRPPGCASARDRAARRARAWYSGPCLRGSAYSFGLSVQYVPLVVPYQLAPPQSGSNGAPRRRRTRWTRASPCSRAGRPAGGCRSPPPVAPSAGPDAGRARPPPAELPDVRDRRDHEVRPSSAPRPPSRWPPGRACPPHPPRLSPARRSCPTADPRRPGSRPTGHRRRSLRSRPGGRPPAAAVGSTRRIAPVGIGVPWPARRGGRSSRLPGRARPPTSCS